MDYPLDFPGLVQPKTSRSSSPGTLTGIPWNFQRELALDDDPQKKAAFRITQATLNILNGDLGEEDENARSDVSDGEAEPGELILIFCSSISSTLCITDLESDNENFTQQLPKLKRPCNYCTSWNAWLPQALKIRLVSEVHSRHPDAPSSVGVFTKLTQLISLPSSSQRSRVYSRT